MHSESVLWLPLGIIMTFYSRAARMYFSFSSNRFLPVFFLPQMVQHHTSTQEPWLQRPKWTANNGPGTVNETPAQPHWNSTEDKQIHKGATLKQRKFQDQENSECSRKGIALGCTLTVFSTNTTSRKPRLRHDRSLIKILVESFPVVSTKLQSSCHRTREIRCPLGSMAFAISRA